MQVILQQSVKSLGFVGDLVNVRPGYYRNFLGPRALALLANPKSIKQLEHQKKIIEAKKVVLKAKAMEQKEVLEKLALSITHAAGAGEKLFGSITNKEIMVTLREAGHDLDRKQILLVNPIRTIGEHLVEIKLHPEVVAGVKLNVLKKEEKIERSAEENLAKSEKTSKPKKAKKAVEIEVKAAEVAPEEKKTKTEESAAKTKKKK